MTVTVTDWLVGQVGGTAKTVGAFNAVRPVCGVSARPPDSCHIPPNGLCVDTRERHHVVSEGPNLGMQVDKSHASELSCPVQYVRTVR